MKYDKQKEEGKMRGVRMERSKASTKKRGPDSPKQWMNYVTNLHLLIHPLPLNGQYYDFKFLNQFRQLQAYSKKNFRKIRGPRHTYYYIVMIT